MKQRLIGYGFGLLVIAIVWAIMFVACWRFAEWLQK